MREGGTCVSGLKGLEDVTVVWLCLVCSLDKCPGFLVVDSIVTSLACCFLLAPTVPMPALVCTGPFTPVPSLKLPLVLLSLSLLLPPAASLIHLPLLLPPFVHPCPHPLPLPLFISPHSCLYQSHCLCVCVHLCSVVAH